MEMNYFLRKRVSCLVMLLLCCFSASWAIDEQGRYFVQDFEDQTTYPANSSAQDAEYYVAGQGTWIYTKAGLSTNSSYTNGSTANLRMPKNGSYVITPILNSGEEKQFVTDDIPETPDEILGDVIWCAPDGNDATADGSEQNPFFDLQKAVAMAQPGDRIWMKAGTYVYDKRINIDDTNGEPDKLIELCNFYRNGDTGLQMKNLAANNKVINCDSYLNCDEDEGDADGFAPKLSVGDNNYFYGCRAWANSDDGWDVFYKKAGGFGDNMTVIIENSISYKNGFLSLDKVAPKGNGNGFKCGSNQSAMNVFMNRCLAVYNKAKGFDQNHNAGDIILNNCTGITNTSVLASSSDKTYSYRIIGKHAFSGQTTSIRLPQGANGLVVLKVEGAGGFCGIVKAVVR